MNMYTKRGKKIYNISQFYNTRQIVFCISHGVVIPAMVKQRDMDLYIDKIKANVNLLSKILFQCYKNNIHISESLRVEGNLHKCLHFLRNCLSSTCQGETNYNSQGNSVVPLERTDKMVWTLLLLICMK
uniref:Uncharacterized protein n=1 Tax=Sphaerodactylus townsendi TaxID=933632 RepID=A0ACB8ESN7_9SAUR